MATDNSDRIDRFLREQMTPEENDAFLRDLETDEALRKEAQLTALMIQELHERQAKQDAEIIEEVVASRKQSKKARIIRMMKWAGSIAALLLLLFGVYIYQSDKSSETDYIALADRFYQETAAPNFRGGVTDADEELTNLFDQVGNSDDIPGVISRLQDIYDHLDTEYAYRANGNDIRIAWYLALAYLKDKQPDKATLLLRTIIQDDKGTELGANAKELLNSITTK